MYPPESQRLAHLERALRLGRELPEDAAVSHESAAIVWGLPTFDVPAAVSATRTRGRPVRTSDLVLYVAGLRPWDVTVVNGCPVTSLARTAVDVARRRPFLHALMVADAALARRVSRSQLQDVLRHQWNWPRVRHAMPVVREADARSESPLESWVRGRCILLDLPRPQAQVRLPRESPIARVDFWWEEFNLFGEADGRLKYLNVPDEIDDALVAEKDRHDALYDAGLEGIRWRWRQALVPDDVFADRLLRAMRRGMTRRYVDGLLNDPRNGTNLIDFPPFRRPA